MQEGEVVALDGTQPEEAEERRFDDLDDQSNSIIDDESTGDNNNDHSLEWSRRPQQRSLRSQRPRPMERRNWKLSQVYCVASAVLALLAIITAPSSSTSTSLSPTSPSSSPPSTTLRVSAFFENNSVEQIARAAVAGVAAKKQKGGVGSTSGTNAESHHQPSSVSPASSGSKIPSSSPDIVQSFLQILQVYLPDPPPRQQQEQQQNSKHTKRNEQDTPVDANEGSCIEDDNQQCALNHHSSTPFWLRWAIPSQFRSSSSFSTSSHQAGDRQGGRHTVTTILSSSWCSWIDPALFNPSSTTPTDIIDKILTSTPRLLAVANFLLAMAYLMHAAVAAWFLGTPIPSTTAGTTISTANNNGPNDVVVVDWAAAAGARERMGGFLVFKLLLISAVLAPDTLDLLILLTWYTLVSCLRSLDHLCHATTTHTSAAGQSPRRGVLRLLCLVLVCTVLAAASCVALFHAAGWGMVSLLTCDCALLAVDVISHMLRHFTGVMEELHTNSISSLEARQLRLFAGLNSTASDASDDNDGTASTGNGSVEGHAPESNDGEEQSQQEAEIIDNETQEEQDMSPVEVISDVQTHAVSTDSDAVSEIGDDIDDTENMGQEEESATATAPPAIAPVIMQQGQQASLQQESRQLDRQMEVLELVQARRLSVLDSTIFALQLLSHLLTVAHFLHIWSLHGVQFTLIDGVLALHLHSAISSACKKIAQRRNVHTIARDLNGLFPNASEHELRKASQAGDVCCICLGTMSTAGGSGGHVKKVKCGHLYHTHCLREVVERAQSIQAAKCPLCRASVVDGRHTSTTPTTPPQNNATVNNNIINNNNNTRNVVATGGAVGPAGAAATTAAARSIGTGATADAPPPPPVEAVVPPPAAGEHALFRFSTEGIVPAWIPLPAFSFEVVRRPPLVAAAAANIAAASPQVTAVAQPATNTQAGADGNATTHGEGAGGDVQQIQPNPQQQQQQSFLRRFLALAGAIPMSPEEEARALGQLVDMFPQYDRSDLLRELRDRGSSEAVVEAVLMGLFSGVARGDR